MSYTLREINKKNESELDWVTKHTMETVLATIPEFENNPDLVLKQFPNFTFKEMKQMISSDLPKENHCLYVIEESKKKELVGHSIFSLKTDEKKTKYGFCFSRYIAPTHRRKGLASMLLTKAEEWWISKGAQYVIAHTHETNFKLQGLFKKLNYEMHGPSQGNSYNFYILRKDLTQNYQ